MQTIANDTELNHLRPYALSALIPFHVKKKDYGKAIDLSDQIIQEFPNDPIVCELTFGKGLIYKYFLNDAEKAKEMFILVVSQCPDHKSAQSAKEELENTGLAKNTAEEQKPAELSVQNYPNPFNPSTTFRYALPATERVVLRIFNVQGQEVATLVDQDQAAGHYEVVWNGRDQKGQPVGSGIYLYQLDAGEFLQVRRMLLLK